jgi:hypothetical protein
MEWLTPKGARTVCSGQAIKARYFTTIGGLRKKELWSAPAGRCWLENLNWAKQEPVESYPALLKLS